METDGSITGVEILKGIGAGCEEEGLRVVKSMPNWYQAAIKDGKKVKSNYKMPIRFRLTNPDKDEK